jgi:hypothetical protein
MFQQRQNSTLRGHPDYHSYSFQWTADPEEKLKEKKYSEPWSVHILEQNKEIAGPPLSKTDCGLVCSTGD